MITDDVLMNEQSTFSYNTLHRLLNIYRNKIDKYIIYIKQRWFLTFIILLLYIIRIHNIGGFYVVSYVIGLFLLHLAVQFHTPMGIVEIDEEEENQEIIVDDILPQFVDQDKEERGPLLRSMSEFRYWQNCTLALIIGLSCTFSEVFNLPVFWPFLLAYFLMLFAMTIKRQFRQMKKYQYGVDDFSIKRTK